MLEAAGSLSVRRRNLANQSDTQSHHRGSTAAAMPRCYSHVSKTMVLSVHLCPNRWSACPVSRRHFPRVRATEPEAMMGKTCYRPIMSRSRPAIDATATQRETHPLLAPAKQIDDTGFVYTRLHLQARVIPADCREV